MTFALKEKFAPIVLVALLSALILVASSAFGQSAHVSQLPFKTFDIRGQGVPTAVASAAAAAKKAYVVLLVRGDDPAIIKNAEKATLAVYRSGRERVVLIKGDGDSKLMQIYAKGYNRSYLDKADAGPKTKSATVEAMVEAYDKYVVPEMNVTPKQDLNKK
jgi:hypothetical protein